MKTLTFSISINARPETVWKKLWEPESYATWTTPLTPNGTYKTEALEEGNRIYFLAENGSGMFGLIDKYIDNKYIRFINLGDIQNYEELPIEGDIALWSGALESYELKEIENGTEVIISTEIYETYVDWVNKTYPLALNELKRISEL